MPGEKGLVAGSVSLHEVPGGFFDCGWALFIG